MKRIEVSMSWIFVEGCNCLLIESLCIFYKYVTSCCVLVTYAIYSFYIMLRQIVRRYVNLLMIFSRSIINSLG